VSSQSNYSESNGDKNARDRDNNVKTEGITTLRSMNDNKYR
jgi:hypothetical protein